MDNDVKGYKLAARLASAHSIIEAKVINKTELRPIHRALYSNKNLNLILAVLFIHSNSMNLSSVEFQILADFNWTPRHRKMIHKMLTQEMVDLSSANQRNQLVIVEFTCFWCAKLINGRWALDTHSKICR